MANLKEKHYFPGGNSSKGFHSFYKYILSQKDANRILCLKGGPGTGKSSFMKNISKHFLSKGYTVEFHHCSSDNNSLDGVVIKELNVALLDGTAPHIVDPIHPGAVDEILNLGVALDNDYLFSHKDEIISLTNNISNCYKYAYNYLKSAKSLHDNLSELNSECLDKAKLDTLLDSLKNDIFTSSKTGQGEERHIFTTAITPDGIVTFVDTLTEGFSKKFVLTGGPGFSKTNMLKSIGETAQKKGYYVEYLHDPFIPDRVEHILIPELSTCVVTNNEINKSNLKGIEYNLLDYTVPNSISNKLTEINYNTKLFEELIDKAVSLISKSHSIHDDLEVFYISAMNFNVVNSIYSDTIKKIEKFI